MLGRLARQAESLFQWRSQRSADQPVCVEPIHDDAGETVELSFVLADPTVPLADLFNLAPGDVLLLDEAEGSPLRVFNGDSLWGSASIGWDGDEPAVRLIRDAG